MRFIIDWRPCEAMPEALRIPQALQNFVMFKFDWEQLQSARGGDRAVELEMLRVLIDADADKKWKVIQLALGLHHLVHIADHCQLTDAEGMPLSDEKVDELFAS